MLWQVVLSVRLTNPIPALDAGEVDERGQPKLLKVYIRTFVVLAPSEEDAIRFATKQITDGSISSHPRVHAAHPAKLSTRLRHIWLALLPRPRLFSKSGRIFIAE